MRQEDVLQGSTARVSAYFEDPDTGVPMTVVEPVNLLRRRPDGAGGYTDPGSVLLAAATDATGRPVYRGSFLADIAGTWLLIAASSGAAPVRVSGAVEVRGSPF